MTDYEIMFIVKTTASAEAIKETVKLLQDIIKQNKGEVIELKEMGKRALAYPIKKENTGEYFVLNVKCSPEAIKEFDRKVLINDLVLRHLIIKLEGK